jgi:amino acid transporter
MGTFGGLMLTLAVLSPSLGVFVIGNDMLHQAGSGTVACLLAATILGIAVAALYAELVSAFPHAGAEYALAGHALGPRAAFAMLSGNLVGLPVGVAISGLGIADYLHVALPALTSREVAIPAILGAVSIAACSIRMNATVTGLLVAAEIAALAITTALGVAHLQPGALHTLLHPTMALPAGGIGPVPPGLLAVTAASGIYALNGYGGVACFGEEIDGAHHKVGRVIYMALFIGAGAVTLPLAAVIAAAPDLNQLYRAPAPILGFLGAAGSPALATIVSLSVAGAIFNCMIGIALTLGRILFAAARDASMPPAANKFLVRLHPRFHSPTRATFICAAVAVPLCFVPMKVLIIVNGNIAVAQYGVLAVAVLAGRRTGATARSRSRAPWHPVAPVFVLAAVAALTVADAMDPDSGQPALLATILTALLGVAYGDYVTRRKTGWKPVPIPD